LNCTFTLRFFFQILVSIGNYKTTMLETEEGGLDFGGGWGELDSLKPLRRRSVLDEVFEQ